MFQKLLSSMGIGCAKVDTILLNNPVEVGELLKGEVHITGGKVSQEIIAIHAHLYTHYYKDSNDSEFTEIRKDLAEVVIGTDVHIKPKEKIIVPFELKVPLYCPISTNEQSIYLETDLIIEKAVDLHDKDSLIVSNKEVSDFLTSLENEGYEHTSKSGKASIEFQAEKKTYVQRFMLSKKEEVITIEVHLNEKGFTIESHKSIG